MTTIQFYEYYLKKDELMFFALLIIFLVLCIRYYFTKKHKGSEELDRVKRMSWYDFELFCVKILKQNGYEVIYHYEKEQKHGIDILAQKDKKTYAIQCKKYSSLLNCDGVYEAMQGKEYFNADIAVVMTNSCFKDDAKICARKNRVQLWDGRKITWFINNSEDVKKQDKKENIQRRNKKMYGENGNEYPAGQYIVGEDIPLGKYILKPTEQYSGHITFFSSYEDYISGENGNLEHFGKNYFVNFKVAGNYIVVHDAKFEKID